MTDYVKILNKKLELIETHTNILKSRHYDEFFGYTDYPNFENQTCFHCGETLDESILYFSTDEMGEDLICDHENCSRGFITDTISALKINILMINEKIKEMSK